MSDSLFLCNSCAGLLIFLNSEGCGTIFTRCWLTGLCAHRRPLEVKSWLSGALFFRSASSGMRCLLGDRWVSSAVILKLCQACGATSTGLASYSSVLPVSGVLLIAGLSPAIHGLELPPDCSQPAPLGGSCPCPGWCPHEAQGEARNSPSAALCPPGPCPPQSPAWASRDSDFVSSPRALPGSLLPCSLETGC